MSDILSVLMVVALVVAFITVVGHGLWLLCGAMLRALGIGSEPSDRGMYCYGCGHLAGIQQGVCRYCGYRTVAKQREDVQNAIRLMERLHAAQEIRDSDFQGIMPALQSAAEKLQASAGLDLERLRRAAPTAPDSQSVAGADSTDATPSPQPPAAAPAPAHLPSTQSSVPADDDILSAELVVEHAEQESSPFAHVPHPLDAPEPEPAAVAAAAATSFSPRRTMANMLQSFMEERNIRWGELASGILIVGSAIGLVISLRAKLEEISEQIQYFPALLFMLGTVAIHAAGLYTLRRWKLRSTSRGVLIIATLLVPLSFAAGIVLSGSGENRTPVTSPYYIAAVLVGILGYGAVTTFSARALFSEGWWRLTVVVIGTSAGQLLINRLAAPKASLAATTALFALPLGSYLAATLSQLHAVSLKNRLTPARAAQTYTVLGVAAFALAVPLGLLAWVMSSQAEVSGVAVRQMFRQLSPSLSIAATVVLSLGVTIQRRCNARHMAETRTVGTALAILGGMIMLGTLITAWPDPSVLIAVGAVTAIALVSLAIVGRLPILHAGATAATSFAILLLFHHLNGQFAAEETLRGQDLISALLMGRSAMVLLVLALMSGAIGAILLTQKRVAEGQVYLASMSGVAIVSLAIALYAGFWSAVDADWTTLVFAFYAMSVLAASPRIRNEWVTALGSALALVALIHLCQFNDWFSGRLADANCSLARPMLFSLIAHGLLVVLYGLGLAVWPGRRGSQAGRSEGETFQATVIQPLAISGGFTAALTVPYVLNVQSSGFDVHALYAACIAVTWAVAAGIGRNARLATAAHAAATVAIAFTTAAYALRQTWSEYPLEDLRHWQCQLSVLSIWCAVSSAVRLTCQRWPRAHQLLKPTWPSVDQLLLGAVMLGLVYVGVVGCGVGGLVELGFLSAESSLAADTWHTVAYQSGSWIALAGVLAAIALLLFEQLTLTRLSGLVVATAIIPLLLAGRFEDTVSVASALRWFFAIYALAWTILLTFRKPLQRWACRALSAADLGEQTVNNVRDLSAIVGIAPVAILTMLAAGQMLQGTPLGGPLSDSLFGQMTPSVLYGVPIALLVVSMVVIAVRDGTAVYALIGSLLLQYCLALAVLVPTFSQGYEGTTKYYVLLAQWTACGLSGYALVWLGLDRWINRAATHVGRILLELQLVAAGAATLVLSCWSIGEIFVAPDRVGSAVDYLGLWPSYCAAILGSLALLIYYRRAPQWLAVLAVFAPCAVTALAAATSDSLDPTGKWIAYHVLTGGWLAVTLIAAGIACWRTIAADRDIWLTYLSRAATSVAVLVTVLLVRGCVDDPIAPWWTMGIAAGLFLFFAAQAIRLRKQLHAYASAIVVVFATSVLWCYLATARNEQLVTGFFYANVVAASLVGLFWLAIEIWHQSERDQSLDERFPLARVHTTAALTSLAIMLLVGGGGSAISAIAGLAGNSTALVIMNPWGAGAILALGLLLVAMLWDRQIGVSLIATYLWGIILIAMVLNLFEQVGTWGATGTIVGACLLGAAYVALTGHLWRWGANLAQVATRLQVPHPIAKLEHVSRWLPGLNVLGALVISSLGFVTIFAAEERAMRMSVAFAPLMLAYGMSCLAQQRRKFSMHCLALFLVVVAAIFIGWADVARSAGDSAMLAYSARLLIVLAGMTLAYNLLLTRWVGMASDWYEPVRRTSAMLAITTGVTLAYVLMLEVTTFRPGEGAPIAMPEVIAISIMLLGFIIALLCMAVLPGRDPLSLSEKGREGYVYAAQIIAAIFCAHIYLAKPELFSFGIFKDYWPYIVMAIAFVSVAIGEFCHRRGWTVIAAPMQRTGGFLPVLPALTAMAFSQTNYPLVLFFAGLIYVFMSVTRRSFVAGIAAAVMGNGALWALLNDTGFRLADQPQFWMIPPALSVLVAAYINRDRLSDNALTAIRYICVMIIYLSSTGEMFMKLLVPEGSDEWMGPIILTSLSVAGIFAGILLRVRAFLYLGASFLLLSIVTMVWNAGRVLEHTWPWWVFGISLGLVILVIFGVFEKHRREVQQLVSRLRQWER